MKVEEGLPWKELMGSGRLLLGLAEVACQEQPHRVLSALEAGAATAQPRLREEMSVGLLKVDLLHNCRHLASVVKALAKE